MRGEIGFLKPFKDWILGKTLLSSRQKPVLEIFIYLFRALAFVWRKTELFRVSDAKRARDCSLKDTWRGAPAPPQRAYSLAPVKTPVLSKGARARSGFRKRRKPGGRAKGGLGCTAIRRGQRDGRRRAIRASFNSSPLLLWTSGCQAESEGKEVPLPETQWDEQLDFGGDLSGSPNR